MAYEFKLVSKEAVSDIIEIKKTGAQSYKDVMLITSEELRKLRDEDYKSKRGIKLKSKGNSLAVTLKYGSQSTNMRLDYKDKMEAAKWIEALIEGLKNGDCGKALNDWFQMAVKVRQEEVAKAVATRATNKAKA